MTDLRRLLAQQRWLAVWLLVATLAVRVLVPAGYMPGQPGNLTLTICPGHAPAVAALMAGMDRHHHAEHGGDHDPHDQPCPFAELAMPSSAGADQPIVLASAFAPAATPVGTLAEARAPPRREFLRPPLRGPPSFG